MTEALLSLRDFSVATATGVRIVDGVDLDLYPGERLAMVGESGSGKSATARAILRLDHTLRIGGSATLRGRELTTLSERELARVRGRDIAMVFQDPMGALDPLMCVGDQVAEPLRYAGMPRRAAWGRARELMMELGIPAAADRMKAYPHEFSGGMRQRIVLAMALAGEPSVLLADEPTTALDVRAQAQVLAVIDAAARERNLAVVLITHDLAMVAGFADRVAVMYSGRVVHVDTAQAVFDRPAHPYTAGLLHALPRMDRPPARLVGIDGSPPHPGDRPSGCAFHPRCAQRLTRCAGTRPPVAPSPDGGLVACHLYPSDRELEPELEAR